MDRAVLGESIQRELGEKQVTSLLFCTHDLDPSFFEQEVLQAFIGNDLMHNRRTREIQLNYVIRQRRINIDVYYEGRALAAHEGTARLGWNRIRMSGKHGGKFHPKVILALCTDGETESLLVCTASANLTRGGWWTNVECADVVTIRDGFRHGYVDGLSGLIKQLRTRAHNLGQRSATVAIGQFLSRQEPFRNMSHQGRARPVFLPGFSNLTEDLWEVFGPRLVDTHLEIIAPFIDQNPDATSAALHGLIDTFQPRSVRVALPSRDDKTTISEATYDAVEATYGTAWARLDPIITAAAPGADAGTRPIHAKVYRFRRQGPKAIEVFVIGSHNLTSAAHSGNLNWESSVVIETGNQHAIKMLHDLPSRPAEFDLPEDELESDSSLVPQIPLAVSYDWQSEAATARWSGADSPRVTLTRGGAVICIIETHGLATKHELDEVTSRAIGSLLLTSCVVTAVTEGGKEAPLLIEEQNHIGKPDLLDSLDLTAAEILALWSIPDLRGRLRKIAESRVGTVQSDEDDLELTKLLPPSPPSMFDRFAGVFHAFGALTKRVDSAMKEGLAATAGAALYADQFDSPMNVLRLTKAQATEDPALAYVMFACARQLDHDIEDRYPQLAGANTRRRSRLLELLDFDQVLRARIVEDSQDPQMSAFLDWFDRHFAGTAQA